MGDAGQLLKVAAMRGREKETGSQRGRESQGDKGTGRQGNRGKRRKEVAGRGKGVHGEKVLWVEKSYLFNS